MVDQNNGKEIKQVLDTENNKVIWERAIPTYDTPIIPTRNASLLEVSIDGVCTQNGTPTPNAHVDIMCNNGTLKMIHQNGLPDGYRLLEYVGGSGSQYIPTPIKLASTDIVEAEFQIPSVSGYGALYGIYEMGQSSVFYANRTYYIYDETNTVINTDVPVDTAWHSVRHDFVNGILTLDGNDYTFTPFSFVNTQESAILARYYGGSYGYFWQGYIRKFKVIRGGEVICDLLPAKDSSDVAGLYDLVTGNFYTAMGGTLLEGNEVDDYEQRVVGIPEVLSVGGVNLCTPAYYDGDGWYISASDQVANAASNGTLIFPCKPNTTYSWWHTDGAGGGRAFELTTDTITAGQEANWAVGNPAYNDAMTVRKYTTSADAKLLCVLFARLDAERVGRTKDEQLADFMLVEGDIEEAFAYQPYQEPQTVAVPNLFAVGSYADKVEIISGILLHKVGLWVLNGQEPWELNSVYGETDNAFLSRNAVPFAAYSKTLLCTHFVNKASVETAGSVSVGVFAGSQISFFCGSGSNINSVDAWKAYLAEQYAAGTPVIVLYVLAEETTESITPHTLQGYRGKTMIVTAQSEYVTGQNIEVKYLGIDNTLVLDDDTQVETGQG